jgi:hypothetical protein
MIGGIVASAAPVNVQGVPEQILYPEVRAITQGTSGSGAHTNTITAAATSDIGDRLLLMVAVTGTGVLNAPVGWTLLLGGSTTGIGIHVFYRTKTAHSESVSLTIPAGRSASSIAVAIKANTFDPGSEPIASSVSTQFNTFAPNPPMATDGGGLGGQLVLAFAGHSVPTDISEYPLPNSQTLNPSNCSAILCATNAEVSSYDPGAFVLTVPGTSRAVTILNRAPTV